MTGRKDSVLRALEADGIVGREDDAATIATLRAQLVRKTEECEELVQVAALVATRLIEFHFSCGYCGEMVEVGDLSTLGGNESIAARSAALKAHAAVCVKHPVHEARADALEEAAQAIERAYPGQRRMAWTMREMARGGGD